MKTRLILVSVVAFAFVVSTFAVAQNSESVDELKEIIVQQKQAIEVLNARVTALEAAQKGVAPGAAQKSDAKANWTESIKVKGDFRFRHEVIDAQGGKDRTRQRIRLRTGIDATITPEMKVGVQLATGSADPVSTNETLDGGFTTKGILLDQAYLEWNGNGLGLIAGKMPNKLVKAGGNEIIWDGDLTPEGLFASYAKGDGFVNLAGFWVDERANSSDAGMIGAQAGMTKKFEGGSSLLMGVSYFDFISSEGKPTFYSSTNSFGNTTDVAGNYAEDFNELEFFGEYTFNTAGRPLSIFADYVKNTAASANDTGYVAGFKYGKCKEKGSTEYALSYKRLEADAVVGAFTNSDFAGGGTDVKGFEFKMGYQAAAKLKTDLTYFMNDAGINNGTDYNRLELDMSVKF